MPALQEQELRDEVLSMKRACEEYRTGYVPHFLVIRVTADSANDLSYNCLNVKHSREAHLLLEELKFANQITGRPNPTPEPMDLCYHLAKRAGRVFATYRDRAFALPRVCDTAESSDGTTKPDWANLSKLLSFKDNVEDVNISQSSFDRVQLGGSPVAERPPIYCNFYGCYERERFPDPF